MIRQTTVKNLPRTASVAGGSETENSELQKKAGAMTRETNVKTLPHATIVAGGRAITSLGVGAAVAPVASR